MNSSGYTNDDDDDDDQDDGQSFDDQRDDNSGSDDDEQDDASNEGTSAIDSASDSEVSAHRNLIGDVLEKLSDNGIDVDELAEKAGVDSSDVDALSHDDLAGLTQYVTQHHPGIVQRIADNYPDAQGILGFFTGR